MMVLPCSQLTILIVPASTFRRNDETMRGITPSTPTRTAATITSVSVMRVVSLVTVGVVRLGLTETDARYRTTVAGIVHIFYTDDIPRGDSNASLALFV